MIHFTECLNDAWDYFFLGDPALLSKFQKAQVLSENLISEFTTHESGDLVVQEGVLIPLSGVVANYPYQIFFQVNTGKSVFDQENSDLQFRRAGYVLEVISQEVYLMTIPYLQSWTDEGGIKLLKSNGIRPRIALENGYYLVEVLGGETFHESGWEPSYEFILKKKAQKPELSAVDINAPFTITSKEY